MGCCYSCEEDDGRGRLPYEHHPTLASTSYRGPVPTLRGSLTRVPTVHSLPSTLSTYDPYSYTRYNNRADVVTPESRAVPQRPAVNVIRKPTPTASSSRSNYVPKPIEFKPQPGALYGEYKCRCGYFWVSRLSWRDRYQQCKRCKAHVRPRKQRELRPSDFTSRDKVDERLGHPEELCEMCKQVGGYCGRYNKSLTESRA